MCSVTDAAVVDRVGVGHAGDGGEAAGRRGRVPVRIVSLYSCPGSRRWTWMSMKPGRDHQPGGVERLGVLRRLDAAVEPRDRGRPRSGRRASVEVLAGIDDPAAVDQELRHVRPPPRARRRAGRAPPCAPRRRWSPGRGSPSTGRRRPRGDLDAAVHRPGVHDDDVVLGRRAAARWSGRRAGSTRGPTGRRIRPCRSSWTRSIMITSASLDRLLERVGHLDAHLLDPGRHQRARPADRHLGAHLASAGGCSSAPPGCARCRRRSRP